MGENGFLQFVVVFANLIMRPLGWVVGLVIALSRLVSGMLGIFLIPVALIALFIFPPVGFALFVLAAIAVRGAK